MGALADVTSIVQSNLNARFRMDSLTVFDANQLSGNLSNNYTCGYATVFANWALYIVYSQPGLGTKSLQLYDGLVTVGGTSGQSNVSNPNDDQEVTLGNLRVPNAASKVSKLTVLASEGDAATGSGDTLAIRTDINTSNTRLSNSLNSVTDIFNSTVSIGSSNGGTAEGTSNVMGLDFDTFDVASLVAAGAQSITARAESANGERIWLYNFAVMSTTSTANVGITKSGPATVNAGGTVTYNMTVTNSGPTEAYKVAVSDPIPTGTTFVSASMTPTVNGVAGAPIVGTYNNTTRTVTWPEYERLNVNGTTTATTNKLDYTLVVTAPANPTGNLQNTAQVSSGSYDSDATNNTSSTVITQVISPYNLTVSKTDGQTSIVTGGNTTYTVRVTNSGTANTAGAALRDPAATGLTVTGVTCSAAPGNTCTAAPTTAQIQGTPGVALPALAPGAFYEVQLTATVTAAAGTNVTNTATAALATGQNDAVPGDNTASDTNSVTATPPPPASNPTSYPATCDVIDWATSGVSGTALSGTRTFNSRGGRGITLNLTSATGAGNGVMGYSGAFANYGSWYEVRAVSESIQPVINQAFLTRAGGNTSTNTIVITFPTPVINVRLGITDLDAVGGSARSGDWAQVQASYGGQTFNPDVLVGGGHALAVQAYTGVPSGAGAAMTVSVPGLGNSQMRAASASLTFNTLMGIDAAYGTPVAGVNRQGQGVAYFKGPLTSITLTTGSLKGTAGQAIAFSNIAFCPPSVAVDKAAGAPVRQADTSSDIPYTLTYRNTSLNVGYHPDATVRDATFSPSIPTPTGADPWARQRPQLTDAVLDQIRANNNVASATLRGTPTVSGATNTLNLDATDLSPAFSGTAANPNLLLANTDGRVDVGGSFNVNFTVNVQLGSAVTTPQTVNNQATATGTLLTGSVSATSNSVASTVSPSAALSVTKAVDRTHAVYPSPVGNAEPVPPTLTYTITVSNPGQLTATGVTLTDTLPAGLTGVVVREGATTVSATQTGQNLTWTVGSLASGSTRTFTVTATAPAAATLRETQPQTALVNSVTASASNVATTPPATVSTPTVYTRLYKQVRNLGPQGTLTPAWGTSASGRPGDVLEYCIDFNNYGSAALSNFSLTDNVATNTTGQPNAYGTGQGVRITRGAAAPTYQAFSNPVVVNLGTLGTAESGQVCFRAGVR